TITVEQVLLEPGDEEILRTVSAGIGSREAHDDQRSRICAGAARPPSNAKSACGRARARPRMGPVRARRGADMRRAVPAPLRAPARLFEQQELSEAHAAHSTHAVHAGSCVCT